MPSYDSSVRLITLLRKKMLRLGEYGLSIDLGTSHIGIDMVSIADCKNLLHTTGENPQNMIGSDVLTRLRYHAENRQMDYDLTRMIREYIDSQIDELLVTSDLSSDSVETAIVVGNSAMHHLFFDMDITSLLNEPFTGVDRRSLSFKGDDLNFISIPDAEIYSPPLIGGFVGNDALAMIVHTGAHEQNEISLLLDIGINTEICLVVGDDIYVDSAASGPAFEEMSLRNGMSAAEGAISRYAALGPSGEFRIETIGECQPVGVCGTGSISILASMVREGMVRQDGTLIDEESSKNMAEIQGTRAFLISQLSNNGVIAMTQRDIRMLQQSKAAIRAAIEILLSETNISSEDIDRVYLTGEFGSNLLVDDAVEIGMFPDLSDSVIDQEANGALKGATDILCSREYKSLCELLSARIKYINLTNNPKFDESYAVHRTFDL